MADTKFQGASLPLQYEVKKMRAIQDKHENLLRQDDEKELIEHVRLFLDFLAQAGAIISYSEYRSQLRAFTRYWASFMLDKTGIFPTVLLQPFDEAQLNSEEKQGLLEPPLSSLAQPDTLRRNEVMNVFENNPLESLGRNNFENIVLSQLSLLTGYYQSARKSGSNLFWFSLILSIAGIFAIGFGICLLFIKTTIPIMISYTTSIAGIIVQLVAGTFFYLYNKSVKEVETFHHEFLEIQIEVQNTLLAIKIAEQIADKDKRNELLTTLTSRLLSKGTLSTRRDEAFSDTNGIGDILLVSETNPRAALLLLATRIEQQIKKRLQEAHILTHKDITPLLEEVKIGVENGLFPSETLPAFRDFASVRHRIAHAQDSEIDEKTILSQISRGTELLKKISTEKTSQSKQASTSWDDISHLYQVRRHSITTFARFLYRHLQGYRLLIGLAIVLTFAQVGANLLSSYPLKFIIDKITSEGNPPDFPYADILRHLFKSINPQTDGVIGLSVTLFIVLGLLDAFLSFILLYLAAFIAKNLTSRLSRQLFNHLLHLSVQWYDSHEQGDLVQRVTGNMADLEKFVADGLVDALAGIITIVSIVVIMAVNNLMLTLVAIINMPILGLIIYVYTSKIKAATKKEKKAEGQVSSITTEAMGKIMEIKAFALESFIFKLFLKNSGKRLDQGRKAGNLQAQFTSLVDIVLAIATAVIISIGAISASTNSPFKLGPLSIDSITPGTLVLFLSLLTKLFQPMHNLSKLTTLANGASAASERIQEVLGEQTEVLAIAPDYKDSRPFQGTITYEDVYFSYPSPGTNPGPIILKGINLHIPAGQKVALVGLSGSGKTTLTNLLPRFYDIPQWWGTVKIDGVDINEYPLSVLRSNISIVLQDAILFNGTIRDNIKIGRPEATDEEMFMAAEQACIHEMIIKRPEGYDAKIMNQGKNLSGGQRQRIVIARAILRNTPIIIMDEPTMALDVEEEAEVMRALDGLAEGRTVLMVTHRLSTVGKVNQIIVLKDGRIAEQGTYKELKEKGGIFANLLKVQNAFDIDVEIIESFILTASEPPDPSISEAELLMELDGQVISKRQLDKVVLTIGRTVQNDIQVPLDSPAAQHVSHLHAKIVWKNNTWVIEDADSKYGLYYNDQKIDEHVLKDGDRIYIAPAIALVYVQKDRRPMPSR